MKRSDIDIHKDRKGNKKINVSTDRKGDDIFASYLPESPLQDTQAKDSNLPYTKIYLQIS